MSKKPHYSGKHLLKKVKAPLSVQAIEKILHGLANPEIAAHSQGFFKTAAGEYGHGDRFLGIRVPILRQHVKAHLPLPLQDVLVLLKSPWHEIRLFALLVLVKQFEKNPAQQNEIYQAYLQHTAFINNWDLVDSSAPQIVGAYLEKKDKHPLDALAKSPCLWERRIAIMATFYFIRKHQFEAALHISNLLKNDREDLIHKAVGWMLREIGKRDIAVELDFLQQHYRTLPRTMLRYAIERFPKEQRQQYLQGRV